MNNSSSIDSQYAQKKFGSSFLNSNYNQDDTEGKEKPNSTIKTISIKVENNDKKEEEKKNENNNDKGDKKKKEKELRIIDQLYYFPDEKRDRIILKKTKMEKKYIGNDSKDDNHKNLILEDLEFKGFKNDNNLESIDSIEEVEYDSDNDSDNLINDESVYKNNNFNYSEIKDLFKSIKNIHKKNLFSNAYFRFPIKKEQEEILYHIPKIEFEKKTLVFIYDNEKIELTYEKIKKLIKYKEIFINKNDKKINQAYNCQPHNKTYENKYHYKKKYCSNEEYLKKTKKRINHYIYFYRYFYQFHYFKRDAKIIMKDLSNENNSKEYKDMLNYKLNRLSIIIKKKLIFFFYISIIKTLIKEMEDQNKKSNKKYNDNIKENLIYCNKYINNIIKNKKKCLKRKKQNKKNKISKINYIIPFYSDENNNSNKNPYIGITQKGFVIILYINFSFTKNRDEKNEKIINNINNNKHTMIIDDNYIYTDKYDKNYIIINYKNLKVYSPFKIIRLEKCFEKCNYIQDKKNIFLVSIPSQDMAKIIGISDDYENIEILKNITDFKGLVNAIEIKLNKNNYLLSCTLGFKLWYYDSDTEKIEYKKIIPQKKNNNDKDNNKEYQKFECYKELIFIEKKNLLIVQVNFPQQFIFFYNINDDNNIFNLIFITKIVIKKEDPYFSESPFNSCVFKDKYLLIGTKIDKDTKHSSTKNEIKNKNQINDNKNLQKKNNNIIKETKIIKAGLYIINLDIRISSLNKNIIIYLN